MKVLFIENSGNLSAGAFHSLVLLTGKLKQLDIECFVALPDKADGTSLLDEAGIEYIKLRECIYTQMIKKDAGFFEKMKMPAKDFMVHRAAKKLAGFVREKGIDIIHENSSACYIGRYIADITGVKHVWHIREFMEEDFDCRFCNEAKAISMMDRSDAVIAISEAISDKYKKKLSKVPIYMIYNGIDKSRFYNETHEIFKDSIMKLLCVGRVCRGKGQMMLVTAAGILYQKFNLKVDITLAGFCDSNEKALIIKEADKYGISENVHILGRCTDIKSEYDKADVFCMTSKKEAFGLVTVEAMMSGCLVLGSDSGGTREIIRDTNEYGILFEANNVNMLAEKLYYINGNREGLKELAKRGRQRAVEQFEVSNTAAQIASLYKEIL